jgi:hypothetical protein
MKLTLSFCAFLLFCIKVSAQQATINGIITDDAGVPVPFASVYVKNTTKGTSANSEGRYSLSLKTGQYDIQYKAIGYKQLSRKVDLKSNTEINIKLEAEFYELQNVVIKAGAEDPAYAIMRNAIKKRKFHFSEVNTYSCDVYIKGLQKLLAAPKKFLGRDIDKMAKQMGLDSNRKGIVYLSESESKFTFMQPDKVHEEMISSKFSGSNQAFSFNRASDLLVNFYQNLQDWEGLSYRPLVSPLADNAMFYYKYKYIGTTIENGETINKIQVLPRREHDPVFEGYIYIIDDSWRIHSVDLYLTKRANINFVDTLKVKQQFLPTGSKTWMPSSVKFEFTGGIFSFKLGGYYIALFKNYDLSPSINKKEFAEVMRITKDVNKKDSTYWQQARPIPLTEEEKTDYTKKAVLAKKRESKEYLDSLDKENNKLTAGKVIYKGINLRDRYNKEYYHFNSLLGSMLYNTVEGFAIDYDASYSKQIDSAANKYLYLHGKVRYGFSNEKFHGSVDGNIPVGKVNLGFNLGSDVLDLNNQSPITTLQNTVRSLYDKRNYKKLYDKEFASFSVSGRIHGGWLASASVEYANRQSLSNTSSYTLFNYKYRQFTSNNPFTPTQEIPLFPENQSFKIGFRTSYDFSNRYVTYPTGRQYLPSKYPRIGFSYVKGVKSILGSDVDYDLISADISKSDISMGMYGRTSFYVGAGKFINSNQLYYTDYKHFTGTQTVAYVPSLTRFLLLNYYDYSTANKYLEGHVEHNFSGFIMNKIPLIRKLKLQEIINFNYLATPDLKNYTELGVGLQYLNLRVMYSKSFNSGNNTPSGIRLSVGF